EQFVDRNGTLEPRESTVTVRGSGASAAPATELVAAPTPEDVSTHNVGTVTSVLAGSLRLGVARVLPSDAAELRAHLDAADQSEVLVGTWAGQIEPRTLVAAAHTA
ncbi:MAG TPA: hypothetical protein VGP24_03750, partial [Glaciihabitans sp.]|nr:hypothetical protein [Glaciihabitans sp.]